MTESKKKPRLFVRPETAVLTRGFDPRLSVGSARPAVFRSSTYVFSSPEAAERAFAIALGRSDPMWGAMLVLVSNVVVIVAASTATLGLQRRHARS